VIQWFCLLYIIIFIILLLYIINSTESHWIEPILINKEYIKYGELVLSLNSETFIVPSPIKNANVIFYVLTVVTMKSGV
jgi:hypothetical protein